MFRRPLLYFLVSAFFLTTGTSSFLFFEKKLSDERMARSISVNLHEKLTVAGELARQILEDKDSTSIQPSSGPAFFLFTDGRISAWSTNSYVPELFWIGEPGALKFVSSLRGDFITRNWKKNERETVVLVIPLVEKYRITNRYLSPIVNEEILPEGRAIALGADLPLGAAVKLENRVLFFVSSNPDGPHHGVLSFTLITLGILFYLAGVLLWAKVRHAQKRYSHALAILIFTLALLRVAMIDAGFPVAWSSSPIFDSTGFASSSLNPSIGDLFFNSLYVVTVCIYLFYGFHRFSVFRWMLRSAVQFRVVAASVGLLFAFFGFLFPFLYYETVFHNSSVTLDWTQSLNFDHVRILAFLSVLIGSVSSFLFCHIFITLSARLIRRNPGYFLMAILLAGFSFVVYFLFSERDYWITFYVGFGYFVILFFSKWYKGLVRISYLTFLYLVFALLCFALQGSISIKRFTEERTGEFQYRFGMNFLVQRDVLGEFLLNDASRRISQDPFIQANLFNPLLGKGSIRQKIVRVHLNSYFDRYDIQVHLYNPSGEPLDNLSKADFASFINQYQNEADRTNYDGVYFINRVDEVSAKRYVVIAPVSRQGRAVGYVALSLALKKIVPQNVFPELLVDNRFSENFKPEQYSYAIFQGTSIISSFGTFNYEKDFDKSWLNNANDNATGWVDRYFHHTLTVGDFGRVAIVTTPVYPVFYVASNFAFWALLGILLITLGLLVRGAVTLRGAFQLNYATRIQLYIFLAFIIPLVAVSVTTLNWTSASAEDQLKEEFIDKAKKLSETISPQVERYINEEMDAQQLEDFLTDVAKPGGVDASIYSPEGKLMATNQAQIFDNLILSNLINPEALLRIRAKNKLFINEEQVGKLRYNDSYSALQSPGSGALLGILSIPFFESGYSLEKSRITILSNVLIVFIIIFVLFTVLSFVATRWLTFPLRMITRSLSHTTLKAENKLLNWQSNDEIGWMVLEYNKMVTNLEKSKVELARSQKESAWREMAQQVAHEIKNPLTPMKLTLQQMEMLLHEQIFPKEKTAGAVKNLLVQLEILNDIATSFSSFARMPAPILQKIEITTLLEKAVNLYAHHPAGKVVYEGSLKKLYVMGDEQLLTRIFSNLILNGLQSGGEDQEVIVRVALEIIERRCVIRFMDNGQGIEEHMREKVFLPHFTTKKSGSGLGLAISKQGIEQSGGAIWFETKPGAGSTFFISLPLAG